MSPDPDQEYFSDGMTEEIITDLSKVHDLCVLSRTSSMALKGSQKAIQRIGRELNVRYVLEGSVRKAGNRIRITAQLIDAIDDTHLWAEKYDGILEDIFDIQEHVSRAIVNALRLKLSPKEEKEIADRPIPDVHALECYHRARQEVLKGTSEGLQRALKLIDKGLEIVGENELLYAALGNAYLESINLIISPDESQLQEVEECALKVFDLNTNSSYGHFLRGAIHYKRGKIQDAVRDLKRALRVDPNDPQTLFYISGLLGFSGKGSIGRPYARRLLDIDPLTPLSQIWWAWVELLDGRLEVAIEPIRKTYQTDPENALTAWLFAVALALNNRLENAYTVFSHLGKQASENPLAQLGLFFMYSLKGDKEQALKYVTPVLSSAVRWDEHASWIMADCYALNNQREEALDWLQHAALNRGFINYPFLCNSDPFLENIRCEPRFKKLMERVKYEWEHFEV